MQSQTDSYHTFTYTDSELDLSAKENYALDICLGTNRISFTLFNANRVLGFRYINTNINILEANASQLLSLVNALEWYSSSYKNIRVFIDNETFSMIPEALFDVTQAGTYLNLVHKKLPDLQVLHSALPKNQSVCVFSLSQYCYAAINSILGTPLIMHQSMVLLQTAAEFNESDLKQHLLVYVSNSFIAVLQYHQNEIKFLNTYHVDADTDTVYFILSVAEQLKLQADKFGIYVMGDISSTSATMGLLKKYIPNVQTINRVDGIQYPLSFREFQEQQHYLAIHTLLCE
jgi:hypothetical protein